VRAWCERYLHRPLEAADAPVIEGVRVRATGQGRFQQVVESGPHRLIADGPKRSAGSAAARALTTCSRRLSAPACR
jgi:putative redox protein